MSKIIGVTVGTTRPRANLGQTDPKKSDYIKNRPTAKTEAMTQPVGVDEHGDLWTVPGGADASGTAASKVTEHNAATDSHNDIRLLIQGLDTRLTALADSDDTTLDQLSELVAYIKDNRELIESVTTAKVNVADIINNLTTNAADKPLSAAQGVALKALIDNLASSKADSASVATAISTALAGYAKTSDIPTTLKNPNALTFCGKTYDGSAAVTVTTDEIVAAVVAALPDWEETAV